MQLVYDGISRQKTRIFSTLSDTGNRAPATLGRFSQRIGVDEPQFGSDQWRPNQHENVDARLIHTVTTPASAPI
jgi:hypothetical protein